MGYALDKATLQQIAYNNGIKQNINTMTQAQKSQLRYLAILQQSTNVMGDMARTVTTPANSIRILNQQLTQFKRAIGNVVSVLAVKIIPYLQVAIRLLTDFANYLADLWGFKLPEIDYSSVGKGMTAVEDDAEDATDAVEDTIKAVQRLAGFDEINVLKSAKEDADDTASMLSDQFDLGIDLPEYDFLQGVENSSEELYQKAKKWLTEIYKKLKDNMGVIKTIAGLLAGLWAVNKVKKFVDALSSVRSLLGKTTEQATGFNGVLNKIKSVIGTLLGTAVASQGSYSLFKSLANDTAEWYNVLFNSAELVSGLAMSWIFGGGKGLAIASIAAAFSGLKGYLDGIQDSANKALEALINAEWYTGGYKISDAANDISRYYDTLVQSENKLLNEAQSINQTKEDIISISQNIDTLLLTLANAEDVDVSAVDKIKNAFDELAKTTNNYIQENADTLKAYLASYTGLLTEMGYDVPKFMEFIDKAAGNTQSRIEEIQAEIDKITQKGSMSAADSSKLQVLQQQLLEISNIKYDDQSKQIEELEKSIQSLASLDINLENIETAYNSFTTINDKFGETLDTIEKARDEAIKMANLGDYDTEAERKAVIDAINSIYDVKVSDLTDTFKSIENIGDIIIDTWKRIRSDIVLNYDPGWSPADYDTIFWAKWFGSKTSEEKTEEYLRERYQEFTDQYGSFFTNANKYAIEQIALASGKTVDEIERIIGKSVTKASDEISKTSTDKFDVSISDMSKKLTESGSKKASETGKAINSSLWSSMISDFSSMENSERFINSHVSEVLSSLSQKGAQNASEAGKQINSAFWLNVFNDATDTTQVNDATDSLMKKIWNIYGQAQSKFSSEGFSIPIKLKFVVDQTLDQATSALEALTKIPLLGGPMSSAFSSLLSVFKMLKTLKVNSYATGGMPINGDLFYANENGKAEFISRVGNRTAVANQEQMRSEIREGVREGFLEAMQNRGGGYNNDPAIYVFIDGEEVVSRVESNNRATSKRTGGK